MFLKEKGFPPFRHLHSGNVMVQNGVARICGLENTLTGASPRCPCPVGAEHVEALSLGRVLCEIAYGTPNFGAKLLTGITAGAIGAVVGNPAEVALIRMTADGRLPPEQRRNYTNAREMLLPSLGDGIFLHFSSSMISGFVTTAASQPLDMIKTREDALTQIQAPVEVDESEPEIDISMEEIMKALKSMKTGKAAGYDRSLMDPWGSDIAEKAVVSPKFEDDFKPAPESDKLSDSAEYLAILEKKLKSIRAKNKVVENLSAYRADCIERLMREGCDLDPVIGDTEEDRLIEDEPQ
ncbi:hypothetical protein MSG28_013486 [Choristoneura fumiferana]|uniref:Uncharacterized protein n=1 Tax=Choristoneura fumiferana TaxID=7141 RepID=A0ACC0KTD2_CHOFU|nr:hypothetical protein MSG28_013486 [Choristoneura fumiferana]